MAYRYTYSSLADVNCTSLYHITSKNHYSPPFPSKSNLISLFNVENFRDINRFGGQSTDYESGNIWIQLIQYLALEKRCLTGFSLSQQLSVQDYTKFLLLIILVKDII